ncbi:hypothetical protein [Desulfosediminicola sp.]|uniref:hypothetical protein n=1 Tax=Desulfosediminicola sp. TaxID=2886825 RepID=UPI003AF29A10
MRMKALEMLDAIIGSIGKGELVCRKKQAVRKPRWKAYSKGLERQVEIQQNR